MSAITDRLRSVIRPALHGTGTREAVQPGTQEAVQPGAQEAVQPGAQEAAQPAAPPALAGTGRVSCAAQVLGGEWRESRGHRFLIVDRTYGPDHRHGCETLAGGLALGSGTWSALATVEAGLRGTRFLFLDLETTGLAGGAGTYAFLVGCAWLDNDRLRVRQFFLSSFSAERALLEALAELACSDVSLVTYNGKSFDLPLIETRFVYHRLRPVFADAPHLDMLHTARRLWRADDEPRSSRWSEQRSAGCRLTDVEQSVCGFVRRGDVPGFEIPSRYFTYVRSGEAWPLQPVLEHNRLDLLSLALLTARAARLIERGSSPGGTAREALGLGRIYERAGLRDRALDCYGRAASLPGPAGVVAEALRACAVLCRRQRRHEEAAAAWRRVLDLRRCPPHILREAAWALAVHHEHRLRDPLAARGFALRSIDVLDTAVRRQALQHRLDRLGRKMGPTSSREAPLF